MYIEYYIMGIILIPGILLSLYAQLKVKFNFDKFNSVATRLGKSAKEVCRFFLDSAGLQDVQIVQSRGFLSDYYSDKKKTIGLSEEVYNSNSISAIGVACHEVGHALQYKDNYPPIKLRNFIIPYCNITNKILWIIILLGAIFAYSSLGTALLWIGVGIFGLSTVLNLITLPVEYNASKRAVELLYTSQLMSPEEVHATKKVLNAAALTYVAALVVSILNLLRLIFVVSRQSKD